MTFEPQHLQLPRQGRGSSLLMRFTVLLLNFIALICLCVNLGLYHKWAPKRSAAEVAELAYYEVETLTIIPVKYWEDPVVIVAVLLSIIWTAFIYLRPAWSRKALHPGVTIASELLLSVIILSCSIPAFILSPLQPPISGTFYEEIGPYCMWYHDASVHYCGGWADTLRALQKAAYAFVWAVA